MPESITITTGLPADDPWVIKDTDKNLQNLAVGKLASLSGEQAAAVNAQTATLSETVAKVELINSRLNELSNLSPIPVVNFDLRDEFTGNTLYPLPLLEIYINDDPERSFGVKYLSEIKNLTTNLENNNVNFGDYDAYTYTINSSIAYVASGPLITFTGGSSPVNATPENGLLNGQIYGVKQPGSPVLYGIVGSGNAPRLIDPGSLKGLVIPESKYEITQWENQKIDFSQAVSLYDLLQDTTILVANTNPGNQKSNELTMAVNIGNTNAVEVIADGQKYYSFLPIQTITNLTGTLPQGTIFKDSSGVIRITVNNGNFNRDISTLLDPPKYFAFNPDKNQINSWRSQYAEKQVILTQKASEQGLFLNELVQKYNYFSDATTNVLKAFTNLKNQLINNL